MPQSPKVQTEPAGTGPANPDDAWEEFYGDLVCNAWQPALRFALDCDRAAERCRRRACKLAGKCCVAVYNGESIDCGGGLPDETMVRASEHVLFGCIMVRRFAEDIGLVPTDSPDPRETAERRAVSRRRKKS